jgi:hypothetical protein
VIIDEWAFQQFARPIWRAAFPTINRPTGGQVIGISTAERGTLFEELVKAAIKGLNSFKCLFVSWRADPRRDDAWYEQTKRDMHGDCNREYPSSIEEAFAASEGTAFPEWDYEVNTCEDFEIPSHWRMWMGCDNGYEDPFYWCWITVDENSKVYIIDEYTREKGSEFITYSEQAREVILMNIVSNEEGVKTRRKVDFISMGIDAWNKHHRDQTGKNITDYYRQGGLRIPMIKAETDRILRKAVWHEYLKPYKDENTGLMTSKVQIFRNACPKLIEIMPQLLKDPVNPNKVADDSSLDNAYDGAGYGIIAYHKKHSKAMETTKTVMEKDKDNIAKHFKHRKRRYT